MSNPQGNTRRLRKVAAIATTVGALAALASSFAPAAGAASDDEVFVPSASVNGERLTLPLHEARTRDGRTAWYVVIEASDGDAADRWNVEVVNKLRNAGDGAQRGSLNRAGVLEVEASVNFRPAQEVAGTPGTGFPPTLAQPGSVGEPGYSPLVRLADGSVINAPIVANSTGVHDKVTAIDYSARRVTLALTHGFARTDAVRYLSTDASDAGVAALEGATHAPRLARAPKAGDDSTGSARASLAAFVNGPTGVSNPQRQGVNSALLGEGDPLNILAWTPNQGRYSPLWDVHLSRWAAGQTPTRVTEFAAVEDLAGSGAVIAADGGRWRADDVVVNCPIIAMG